MINLVRVKGDKSEPSWARGNRDITEFNGTLRVALADSLYASFVVVTLEDFASFASLASLGHPGDSIPAATRSFILELGAIKSHHLPPHLTITAFGSFRWSFDLHRLCSCSGHREQPRVAAGGWLFFSL